MVFRCKRVFMIQSGWTIPTRELAYLFPITYLAAFLLVAIAYVYQGVREKLPLPKVFLALSAGVFFFVIGSKAGAYSQENWQYVLQHLQLPMTGEKSILTGYLGLFLGLVIVGNWLKFNPLLPDKSALVTPIAIGIQQFGCLFAGCCYGNSTGLPWGIRYYEGSAAVPGITPMGHFQHLAVPSHTLHPAPVYMFLLMVLAFVILLKTYRTFKTPGTIRFFAIFLFLCGRFVAEFFRDPHTDHFGGEVVMGLKGVQWILLGSALVLGLFTWYWEQIWRYRPWKVQSFRPGHLRSISLLLFLFILYFYTRSSLEITERILLRSMLAFSSVAMITALLAEISKSAKRKLVVGLSITTLLFMGQSYRTEDLKPGTYNDFDVSGSLGRYYYDVTRVQGISSSCGNNYAVGPNYNAKRTYTQSNATFSVISVNSKLRRHIGDFGISFGNESERLFDTAYHKNHTTFRYSTAYRYESKGIGLLFGFHLGTLYNPLYEEKTTKMGELDGGPRKQILAAQYGFRLGPEKIFYIKGMYGGSAMDQSPLGIYSIGAGTGFGNPQYPSLEAGFSYRSTYVRSEWAFSDNMRIRAIWYNGDKKSGIESPDGFTFGLTYRLKSKKSE